MNEGLQMFIGLVGSSLFAVSGAIAQLPTLSTGRSPETTIAQLEPSTAPPPETSTNSPRRLEIAVSITAPEDLKVAEGDVVEVGQILADRDRERERLYLQREQLQLSLDRLESAIITPPLPPAPVPEMANLPAANYQERNAQIERAKAAISTIDLEIQDKIAEIKSLDRIDSLDPAVIEHERSQLERLRRERSEKLRDYQLAIAQLATARQQTQHQEYLHSLSIAERIGRQNQAALQYQAQLQRFEQQLRDREYQLTQTRMRLDDINNQLAEIATVRSPYAGEIRRVRWIGQNPDGSLSVELSLMVGDGRTAPVSR
ncbi:hypothetical protein [Baaleninema sp.]|uniref:hypothetical protein n=1 Tax=Baaleninema sp. TaxID=3101197 RepID=UPI003CFCFE82